MLPSFLCIGFQKCGTTTLYDILRQHRGIVLTDRVKEPMYYRVKGVRMLGGKKGYEMRYFSHITPEETRLVGEVNAGLAFDGCAKKLGRDFPESTKLIFMMRNPVDRCYSAYKYFLARGFLPLSVLRDDRRRGHAAAFHSYVQSVLSDPKQRKKIMDDRMKYICFSQGNYNTCIGEFLAYFPRENIKLIVFEEFVQDERAACRALYDFLGVEEDPLVDYNVKSNEGLRRAVTPFRCKTAWFLKGVNYALDEFLLVSKRIPPLYRGWYKVYRAIRRRCLEPDTDFSHILPETRVLLEDYYRPEKEGVEKLMGRSLDELWFQ